jgi:hypothetical protein
LELPERLPIAHETFLGDSPIKIQCKGQPVAKTILKNLKFEIIIQEATGKFKNQYIFSSLASRLDDYVEETVKGIVSRDFLRLILRQTVPPGSIGHPKKQFGF